MKPVVWSRLAERQLDQHSAFYGQFSADLSERLLDRIDAAVALLVEHPRLGPELPDSSKRKWLPAGTSFVLLYRPTKDGVRILELRDARSDWTLA